MKTSKSPCAILSFAYKVALQAVPPYSHRHSRKTYTQPQLLACLVLKEFLQLDYRKLEQVLKNAEDFRRVLGLKSVPHFTTFQKAAKRLLRFPIARRLIRTTLRVAQQHRRIGHCVRLAALDATGFESHHASSYYTRRKRSTQKTKEKRTYSHFPKAHFVCDTATHLILAVVPEQGPGPDIKQFRSALGQAAKHIRLTALAADAGYDSEESHRYARERLGIRSLIPPTTGRPTDKPPSGYWRRKMKAHLKHSRYRQRSQAETVNSMIKRLLGSALRARTYGSRFREILLRALTHNIMIIAQPP